MLQRTSVPLSSNALRAEVRGRAFQRSGKVPVEVSHGRSQNLVYRGEEDGGHGNFVRASYRRILANPDWARRLKKTYTGSRHLPRAGDRWRGELECANSSDALLMNVFCYPGVLSRAGVCHLLGIERGLRPNFGVRAELAMRNGEVDRTELDMTLGATFVEAKLTETGFGRASRERLLRYGGVEELVDLDELPPSGAMCAGYQLVRGLLAAVRVDGCYLVLLDGRRSDLQEMCFRVLGAVKRADVRQRLRLRTWQELSGVLPSTLQTFLAERFGIEGG